jgi:hypothetical protein
MYGTSASLAVITLAVSLVGAPSAAAAAAGADAFRGEWTSVDTDGSRQWLWIEGTGIAGSHAVRWIDESATAVCGGDEAAVQGRGEVQGDVLNVRATLTCRPGGNPLRTRIEVEFVHATQPDTLTDGFGVTWTRI